MSTPIKQTRVLLKDYIPTGAVPLSAFDIVHAELDPSTVPEGGALFELVWLSVDPYLRGRMRAGRSYVKPFTPGQPLESGGWGAVGKVLVSKAEGVAVGDYYLGNFTWESHSIVDAQKLASLEKIDLDAGIPLSYYVGVLGMPGMTAYSFLRNIAKPQAGDKVFVSGAAGAVGQIVAQLFKNVHGTTVIGSAGSAEKVEFIKTMGYDAAFNYKEASTTKELKAFAPEGLNVYWDNVGGETLDETLLQMADHGRVVICGAISQYDGTAQYAMKNLTTVLSRRLLMQGAIVFDTWAEVYPHFKKEMPQYILDGKVKVKEQIVYGLENAGQAFLDIMNGKNLGKMVVQVAEDPTRSSFTQFDLATAGATA